MRKVQRPLSTLLAVTMALGMLLGTTALAADTEIDPETVFLNMPTSEDLNKAYDGKQPAWVDFDYDISAEATLWVNDQSKGEDGSGLVWLDIYRKNTETGEYEPYDVGRYPGNMEGPGFNMDEAGFFNYGPRYGERYFSLKTIYVGQYKAVFLIPVYGTNTENFNTYQYVEYEVEFEITLPGIWNVVPELGRDADGTAVDPGEPDFDLTKIEYTGDAEAVQVNQFWYLDDAEAENRAGEALEAAPSEIGKYVYRIQVTDGADLDENLYCPFELTDPDAALPAIFWQMDDIFVVDDIVVPDKAYDGQPVTMEDMNITIDPTRIGKTLTDDVWYEYVWYEPNRYGNYTDMIAECQNKPVGPSEPGTYRFQLGVHSDDEDNKFEGHLYILFTISEAAEAEPLPFTDIATEAEYYAAVQYTVENGLFKGVSETLFAPDATITRAQLATVLWRMAQQPEAAAELSDVAADAWYAAAAAWATQETVIPATEGAFAPTDAVSYAVMADALTAMAQQAEGADLEALETLLADIDQEADITRAQVAVLLMGYCENVLK